MNFKTTGLLVALLVIVAAVLLFLPKRGPQAPERAAPETTAGTEVRVFDPQPDTNTIMALTIERAGKPRLAFARSAKPDQPDQLDNWRALEPLAVPVENGVVNSLVSTFTTLMSRARFEPGAKGAPSPADAGLSPPAATVTLKDKEGKERKLEVGRKAALSTDTYVRVAGQPTIHTATRDLETELKKDFKEYRDKKLVPLSVNDAVRVEINAEGKTYRFTRGADGAWVVDEPVKAYAVRDEVLALLRKVSYLRVQEFVADAPAALASYGLDQPYLTITATTETKRALPPPASEPTTQPAEPRFETKTETFAVAIGGFADVKKENRYARLADQPWVVSVKHKDLDGLVPDLLKLRDPLITRVKAADAARIELTAGGTTATLEKVGGTWSGSGDLAELESAAATDLLEAFEDLSAIDYVLEPGDPATYGLDQPRAVVRVAVTGAVEPVTVRVGGATRSGRNAYVQRDGQPTVFVVAAAQADRLAVPPLSLRSRGIFTGEEQALRRLEVARGSARYALARDGGGTWKLSEPADAPVDAESVRVLVGDLSRLRARRVVGRDEDARYGLDQPAVTIRFTVEGAAAAPTSSPATQATTAPATQPATATGTQPASAPATQPVEHILRVGWKDGVAYCRVDDDPYIFELDETVYRVLTAELIQRKLFEFKAEDVVGLTTVAPGGTLELAKDGEQWKFTPDPFVKLDPKKVDEFVKEVAALRVEAYLQYRDGDLAATGLFTAPVTVSIKLRDGRLANLKMEQERPGALPRLAGWVEEKRIFRLRQADCEKLLRGLDYYLKTEPKPGEAAAPDDGFPGQPPPLP